MKLHIGTDTGGGVHTVVVTDASVHDSCVMEDLLHGDERVIYGDKGYVSEERREAAERSGKTWRVSRRSNRGRKLNAADKAFNRKSNVFVLGRTCIWSDKESMGISEGSL